MGTGFNCVQGSITIILKVQLALAKNYSEGGPISFAMDAKMVGPTFSTAIAIWHQGMQIPH